MTVTNGGSTVCKIKVAPSASFKVIGTHDDVNKFTVSITNLPVSITGGIICPTATKASFNATYQFTRGFSDAW